MDVGLATVHVLHNTWKRQKLFPFTPRPATVAIADIYNGIHENGLLSASFYYDQQI